MDTKNELQKQCQRIADEIGTGNYSMDERDVEEWDGPCAGHYLSEAFDIEYTVTGNFEYRGARVCVAFGGPNICVDSFHTLADYDGAVEDAEAQIEWLKSRKILVAD